MNIFYYSVHHILEDDEVRMLKRLGHNVFRLGTRDRTSSTAQWRPDIGLTPAEERIYDIYERLGGRYHGGATPDEVIPPTFLDHFSAVIVMHSAEFLISYWEKLRRCAVVWRTIGQAVDSYEDALRPLRQQGLKIVRYSERELEVPNSLGQEAIIRFCKDPQQLAGWHGQDGKVLTFSNTFHQRYPAEAADYGVFAKRFDCILGGAQNETFPQSIGVVDSLEQIRLYQGCAAYLYCTGLDIPYTLNFMEAWMVGAPMLVFAPQERIGPYYEIDRIVRDGETGFVCRDLASLEQRARELQVDRALAERISAAGQLAAISFFGLDTISRQWQLLLENITSRKTNMTLMAPAPQDGTPVWLSLKDRPDERLAGFCHEGTWMFVEAGGGLDGEISPVAEGRLAGWEPRQKAA